MFEHQPLPTSDDEEDERIVLAQEADRILQNGEDDED
jgi:hypothetical protein